MSANKRRDIELSGQQWALERSLLMTRHKRMARWMVGLLLLLGLLLVVFSTLTATGHPARYAMKSSAAGLEGKDQSLYRELDRLRRHSHALITGSIESKLRRIEADLRNGTINAVDFETLQSVKEDLKLLKAYSTEDASPLFPASNTASVPPARARGSGRLMSQKQILAEIAAMKNLLYFSLASCGLLFVGVGGLWLRSNATLKALDSSAGGARTLLEKPRMKRMS